MAVALFAVLATPALARAGGPLRPVAVPLVQADTSAPLASITPVPPSDPSPVANREFELGKGTKALPGPFVPDPVVQATTIGSSIPGTGANFEGIPNIDGVLPPDTNGDVGPNHYVQIVNLSFEIFSKAGVPLYGPAATNTLWTGFGAPCETQNDGDPIVLYDQRADRWLISQFALPNFPFGPFYQCIAISQTPDPTGAYHRFAFAISTTKFNDYPHFGIWGDSYVMTINQFTFNPLTNDFDWAGAGVVAFDRSAMLAGSPAPGGVYFDLFATDPKLGGMLPADADGANPPPAGEPAPVVQFDDDAFGYPQDQLEVWRLGVDWSNPLAATFTGPTLLATAPFSSDLAGIPQPGGAPALDPLSDRLMYRLQYRNFLDHEAMVVNHTVDADGSGHGAPRWYELRNTGAGWGIFQQGTYAPDADNRWMAAAGIDGAGDIALGYSVSSATTFPSIRYTGRLAGDPLNTLPQGEASIVAGSGSQTHPAARWGDYSSMSVDPVDDCTFWYTQEYLATTGVAAWRTRIASFTFPSCTPALLPLSIQPPQISGNTVQGQTLSAVPGTWRSPVPLASSFAWSRCTAVGACTPIPGATGPGYTATAADVGLRLRVTETDSGAHGASSADSAFSLMVTGRLSYSLGGTFSGAAANALTIMVTNGYNPISAPLAGHPVTVLADAGTDVRRGGAPATVADMHPGDTIRIELSADPGVDLTATAVPARTIVSSPVRVAYSFGGTFVGTVGSLLTVHVTNGYNAASAGLVGANVTVAADGTTEVRRGGSLTTVVAVRPGDTLRVELNANQEVNPAAATVLARRIAATPARVAYSLGGTLVGATPGTITIFVTNGYNAASLPLAGRIVVVSINAGTDLRRLGLPATPADLVPGDRIRVELNADLGVDLTTTVLPARTVAANPGP